MVILFNFVKWNHIWAVIFFLYEIVSVPRGVAEHEAIILERNTLLLLDTDKLRRTNGSGPPCSKAFQQYGIEGKVDLLWYLSLAKSSLSW